MRESENFKVAAAALKGALLGGFAAAGTGIATVQTTVFFGLIATGSTLSIPVLGVWAIGGALLFGLLAFGTHQIRKFLVRREIEKMMSAPKRD